MRQKTRLNWRVLFYAGLTGLFVLSACGMDEDDGDKNDGGDVKDITQAGYVGFSKASSATVELSFEGAGAGAQFVVMPYSLGDIATVDGAGSETLEISFGGAAAASGLKLTHDATSRLKSLEPMNGREYDLGLRLLWNRFDRSKGQDQEPWFWDLAERLDFEGGEFRPRPAGVQLTTAMPISDGFRALAETERPLQLGGFNLKQSSNCPTEVPIPQFADGTAEVVNEAEDVVDGGSFCLVYLAESDEVTGGTKEEIKATMAAVVSRYKDVVYKDEFAAIGNYQFIPTLVIVDVTDENVWNTQLVLSGVHSSEISTTANRPLVFVASNFSVIPAFQGSDATALKKLWHGTVAHEMQHAIMDYYRGKSGGTEETVAVDEGIAHFMEDVFGYGEENFPIYAGAAINVFPDGLEAAIKGAGGSSLNSATARGAAASFIYYLQSQKGGVSFTNGVVSGGGGFDYVKAVVKSKTTTGTQSLRTPFSEDWVKIVGNYFAALVLDGTALEPSSGAYQVQNPVTGVADLNGATDKTFGMSYNGYLGNINRISEGAYEAITELDGAIEVSRYGTYPSVYTVTDPAAKVTIEFPEATGSAVTVVRIK